MFLAHAAGRPPRAVQDERETEPTGWLDLIEPTDAELQLASRLTGLRIPTRADLEEIENSSRMSMEQEVFYLSMPLVRRVDDNTFVTPIGFVLSPERLITIRYTDFSVFETVARQVEHRDGNCPADTVMVMLIEAMIDRLADLLERMGAELDRLSRHIFRGDRNRRGADRKLRSQLRHVGRTEELRSDIRESLLGLGRIALYVVEHAGDALHGTLRTRLNSCSRDINSLNDYVSDVSNKVQFLLDATLGFINIEQNNGIRLLTVVSIVGIPPTFIASLYGMNFKVMPELNWTYGYYYALTLMALTVIVPMIWFWRRGWLGTQ
nr:magnesium transporter CorA family protein [uncultured Lichenicoccus sp.]